jgi:hypothetical protein
MAGYSGTPLAKKLGIKEDHRVAAIHAPANYRELLQPLPDSVRFVKSADATADIVHLFVSQKAELARALRGYRTSLDPKAVIWVSWPKKASKVPTDITEDVIREVALPLGFVDVKVCAVDDVWSGLKLVVRASLRS